MKATMGSVRNYSAFGNGVSNVTFLPAILTEGLLSVLIKPGLGSP